MPVFLPPHFWTNQRCQWLSWGRRWRLSPSPWQPRCPSQLRMLMTPRRRRGAAAGSFSLGPSWSPPCSGQSGRRAERFKSYAKMIDDFVTLTTMTEKRSLLLRSSCVSRSANLSRLSRVSSLVWAYSSPYFRTWEQRSSLRDAPSQYKMSLSVLTSAAGLLSMLESVPCLPAPASFFFLCCLSWVSSCWRLSSFPRRLLTSCRALPSSAVSLATSAWDKQDITVNIKN